MNEEGIGRISIYTDMLIKKVFKDFYNLAIYSIDSKMFKIKNEGFKKLAVRELNKRDQKSIDLINRLNNLHLEIIEIKEQYTKEDKNKCLKFIDDYPETYRDFIEALALKMFMYGVQFGMEIKSNNSKEPFKW